MAAALAVAAVKVYTASDVDEGQKAPPEQGLRELLLGLYDITQMGIRWRQTYKPKGKSDNPLNKLNVLVYYGLQYGSRGGGRKRERMNVDKQVDKWLEIIVALSTAHDKDAIDAAEMAEEDALAPILIAPVAQLREFAAKLIERLEADQRVPWSVHRMFRAWDEVFLHEAPDDDVIELRDDLAQEIAAKVKGNVIEDLESALVGALRWRSAERLKEVNAAIDKGGKKSLRGRSSCLFLVIGEPGEEGHAEVML